MLNYLDLYFINIIAVLLIVLEVHQSAFLKVYFRVCFVVHQICSPFSYVNPYY